MNEKKDYLWDTDIADALAADTSDATVKKWSKAMMIVCIIIALAAMASWTMNGPKIAALISISGLICIAILSALQVIKPIKELAVEKVAKAKIASLRPPEEYDNPVK
jgi:ABC-type transport system involved in cytochrome bd biosynthesis fused ATPase/permease subunit